MNKCAEHQKEIHDCLLENDLTAASARIAQLNTDKVGLVERNKKLENVLEAAEKLNEPCDPVKDIGEGLVVVRERIDAVLKAIAAAKLP